MRVVYTKHAKDKLLRPDIIKLKVNKRLIHAVVLSPEIKNRTKYGDYSAISRIKSEHDIRIIYDIIEGEIKVITFHISTFGRYR